MSWRQSEYAQGEIDFYKDVFQGLDDQTQEKVDFVARALFAFNTKDSDQGRRETTPQDVYKNEISRFIRRFFDLDVTGTRIYDDFFDVYDIDLPHTTEEMQQIGLDVIRRVNAAQAEEYDVMGYGTPELCYTECIWQNDDCQCESERGNLPCPVEACGLERRPRSLRRLVRNILSYREFARRSPEV